MKTKLTPRERLIRINYRLSLKGLEPLDLEQVALIRLESVELVEELSAMFDDLRDRVGVDCDDLWPSHLTRVL